MARGDQRCENCYFVSGENSFTDSGDPERVYVSELNPPVAVLEGPTHAQKPNWYFPQVQPDWWCGQYQSRE